MAMPRGARSGFIGIPGPRTRRRSEAVYGDAESGDLAARYAEAVRRHDEAAAELRRISDEMAAALQRQADEPAPHRHIATYEIEAAAQEIPAIAAGSSEAAPDVAGESERKRRRRAGGDEPDPGRPTNLRGERNPESGSVCLSWEGAPREGLVFGVWRSVTPREGPARPFERIAMIPETGYIDDDAPADAQRISYAVRALDGRRPVPGSAHVCVPLDADS